MSISVSLFLLWIVPCPYIESIDLHQERMIVTKLWYRSHFINLKRVCMNVSPSFALPIKTVTPYFIFGVISYLFSIASLTLYTPSLDPSDFRLIGTIHLFLLGFVMMIIVGAMGQMSVVVAEIHHSHPSVFRFIFPLFSIGIMLLVYGFYNSTHLLTYGSLLILSGLGLFAYNLFVTLKKSRRKTAVTLSMQWSTLFLFIGIIIGSIMAIGYTGIIETDPQQWLFSHLMSVLAGYVLLNIMGVTTILLPMFGAYARPSDKIHAISFYSMIVAVVLGIIYGLYPSLMLQYLSLAMAIFSIVYYLWSIFKIVVSRKHHHSDIWERSIATAYLSFVFAIIALTLGILIQERHLWIVGFWLLFVGFFGFLIFAHLYKIIPFLVWFEKYAPRIEEQAIPTIQEMLSNKWAMRQWYFGIIGLSLSTLALIFQIAVLWYIGIIGLTVSGLLLFWICVETFRK